MGLMRVVCFDPFYLGPCPPGCLAPIGAAAPNYESFCCNGSCASGCY